MRMHVTAMLLPLNAPRLHRETVHVGSNVPALTQICTFLFHSESLTTYSGTFKFILKLSLNSMYEHLSSRTKVTFGCSLIHTVSPQQVAQHV